MGYRGKMLEREQARRLRALGWTMPDIAGELGVSRSSVSLWTRDVVVERGPRRMLRPREPNALERRKQAEIAELSDAGRARIGELSERELLVAGVALYAGEGTKGGSGVGFANSDVRMVMMFCSWLRRFFDIDESRLRLRLYLHQGLDLDAAMEFWFVRHRYSTPTVPSSLSGGAPPKYSAEQIRAWLHVCELFLLAHSPGGDGAGAGAARLVR